MKVYLLVEKQIFNGLDISDNLDLSGILKFLEKVLSIIL